MSVAGEKGVGVSAGRCRERAVKGKTAKRLGPHRPHDDNWNFSLRAIESTQKSLSWQVMVWALCVSMPL